MRRHARQLDGHLGKVLRINPDGTAPADNPFAGRPGARAEIWSIGHRNIQAAAVDSEGRLWTVEHGPQGGDELNLIQPGGDYGWPVQSYGEEYSGRPIRGSATAPEGILQPVYYWDPVIAPSGAQWYDGGAFPAWRGSLFIGSMVQRRLVLQLQATLAQQPAIDVLEVRAVLADDIPGDGESLARHGERTRALLDDLARCPPPVAQAIEPCADPTRAPDPAIFAPPG